MMMTQSETRYRNALKERNDCSVRAVAIATGVHYSIVHKEFAKLGRRKGKGSEWGWAPLVIRILGYRLVNCNDKYHSRTVVTLKRELPQKRGRFLIRTSGHDIGYAKGKVWDEGNDWSARSRKRIIDVYRVEKVK